MTNGAGLAPLGLRLPVRIDCGASVSTNLHKMIHAHAHVINPTTPWVEGRRWAWEGCGVGGAEEGAVSEQRRGRCVERVGRWHARG